MDQTMAKRETPTCYVPAFTVCYYSCKNSGITLKMCFKRNPPAFTNEIHCDSYYHESVTFSNPKVKLTIFSEKATPCP